jgi:hypothetical protein
MSFCRTCQNPIEWDRLAVLPNTIFCSVCAHKHNLVKPRKGVMVFDHKTGGVLQTMSQECYNKNKKYFIPNGARSVVKNFSKNICR